MTECPVTNTTKMKLQIIIVRKKDQSFHPTGKRAQATTYFLDAM